MQIQWDDKTYELNLGELRRREFVVIKQHLGITNLLQFQQGLNDLDPDVLTACLWLIKSRAGEQFDIDADDFDLLAFSTAVMTAVQAEEAKAASAPDPTEPAASTPEPAPTSTSSETATSSPSPTSAT